MTLRSLLGPEINRASFLSWVNKLLRIPIGILTANMTSVLVTMAIEGNKSELLRSGLLVLIIVITSQALIYFTETAYRKLESTALHACKLRLYRQILYTPLAQLFQTDPGDTIRTIDDDLPVVANKRLTVYPEIWTGLITLIVYSVIIGCNSPAMLLVMLFFGVLQLIPPIIVKKKLQVNYDENRDLETAETDYILSAYQGFSLIKLYGLKSWWQKGLAKIYEEELHIGSKAESARTVQSILYHLVDAVLKYGTYIIAGVFVLVNLVPLAAAVQAIALSADLYLAIKNSCSKISDIAVASRAEVRLERWYPSRKTEYDQSTIESISFTNVSFQYEGKTIFSDFTTDLNLSKTILIKGANGSGKSTLLRLMMGLTNGYQGSIHIGEYEPDNLPTDIFPKSLFCLLQEEPPFDLTPTELYNMLSCLDKALPLAKMYHLSDSMLNKTKIRELSGGERKKVFLCLAFAMTPSFLFLDEPTNSLDEQSKETLMQMIKERNGGTIIITHESVFDALPNTMSILLGDDQNEAK